MCWWIFGHCWHFVDESLERVRYKTKCQLHDGFTRKSRKGKYVLVYAKYKCCICGKEKIVKIKEFDLEKAMKLRVYGNRNNEMDWEMGLV